MQIFTVWTKSANPSIFSAFRLLNISTIIPQNDIEHTTVLFNVFELVYVCPSNVKNICLLVGNTKTSVFNNINKCPLPDPVSVGFHSPRVTV